MLSGVKSKELINGNTTTLFQATNHRMKELEKSKNKTKNRWNLSKNKVAAKPAQ